jgi:nucleoside-triphosphatase THEP1
MKLTILIGMKKTLLFAIDLNTQETIISETQKGSNKVTFIERINRNENKLLFDAVVILTELTHSPDFDLEIFKSMDKVCHLIYAKK